MIMLTGIIKTLFVIKNVTALWKQFWASLYITGVTFVRFDASVVK